MRYRIIARHPENKGPVFFWSLADDWTTDERYATNFVTVSAAVELLEFMGVPSAREIGVDGPYIGAVEEVKD
jgi:hypothetical protein